MIFFSGTMICPVSTDFLLAAKNDSAHALPLSFSYLRFRFSVTSSLMISSASS